MRAAHRIIANKILPTITLNMGDELQITSLNTASYGKIPLTVKRSEIPYIKVVSCLLNVIICVTAFPTVTTHIAVF